MQNRTVFEGRHFVSRGDEQFPFRPLGFNKYLQRVGFHDAIGECYPYSLTADHERASDGPARTMFSDRAVLILRSTVSPEGDREKDER